MPNTITGRRKQPVDTEAMRRSISSRDGATSNTVRPSATWLATVCIRFAPKRHARQIVKERLGRVIGDFGDQIDRGLVHIELFASRHQTQGVVKGGETRTTSAAHT